MKKPQDQHFYEFLNVEFNASPLDISRAYKELHELYREDSLASYSFFSKQEREEILAKLQEAYSTLMDEDKRYRYDRLLIERGILPEEMQFQAEQRALRRGSPSNPFIRNPLLKITDELKALTTSNSVIQEILSCDVLSGKDLKRIRKELEISLEVIGEITKIRPIFLRAIEDDAFDIAPSRMFLKSYLKAYAQCIGLDANIVANRYLKRIDEQKTSSPTNHDHVDK
jgi:curved DNA-binding protein CbpA